MGEPKRRKPYDIEAARAARAELREAATAARIRKLIDEWPPLTPEQLDRLSLLLRPGRNAGHGS